MSFNLQRSLQRLRTQKQGPAQGDSLLCVGAAFATQIPCFEVQIPILEEPQIQIVLDATGGKEKPEAAAAQVARRGK